MSEKPEALRLVNVSAVEKELRRQHAEIERLTANRDELGLMVQQLAVSKALLEAKNERLREALTYDWDQLEACRESLREHMVEIKRLREALEKIAKIDLRGVSLLAVGSVLLKVMDIAKAALRREEGA